MMIYKVSYVVRDGRMPGAIKNENERPRIGAIVHLGRYQYEIIDIQEVMPPRDNFQYLHAIVEPLNELSQ